MTTLRKRITLGPLHRSTLGLNGKGAILRQSYYGRPRLMSAIDESLMHLISANLSIGPRLTVNFNSTIVGINHLDIDTTTFQYKVDEENDLSYLSFEVYLNDNYNLINPFEILDSKNLLLKWRDQWNSFGELGGPKEHWIAYELHVSAHDFIDPYGRLNMED